MTATDDMATRAPLSDYGAYYASGDRYLHSTPKNLAEVQAGVRLACARRTPMRVRGKGHAMNGSAVPRRGECLLCTEALCTYRFDESGTITVGAGTAVWDVDRLLKQFGYQLPVCNDGNAAAASVGGFVAAGGFGAASWKHGGFWECVSAMTLVTANGECLHCGADDPLFPWLFGSMGQFGVIVDVTLRILPLAARPGADPAGAAGEIVASHHDWEKIMWHTVFVPDGLSLVAKKELAAIGKCHARAWLERPPYEYRLAFHNFNPPLVHPMQGSLAAVGIWGEAPAQGFDFRALHALERDVRLWLQKRPDYRRYLQSELLFDDFNYAEHFGPVVFAKFAALKRRLDPAFLSGQGALLDALAVASDA